MYGVGVPPSFATGFAQWPGMSEYPQLWEGLVAAYAPFLGVTGNKVFDLSGNGNTGAILSDTIWDSGPFGFALLFDGSGGGVNCGNKSSLDITGDMTIIFSFNPDDAHLAIHRLLHKNTSYSLYIDTGDNDYKLRLHNYNDNSYALSSASLVENEQQHIAVVKRGTVVNFYRNLIDISDDTTITAAFPVSAVDLYLGIDEDLASYPYDGHLDYVMLFSRALSTSEIALLHHIMKRIAA